MRPLLQVALAVASTVAFLLIRLFSRRRGLLQHLPVPEGASRVWGHEKLVFENEAGAMYTKWANELGATFKIKSAWLHPDSLVTADPVALGHIFTKNTFNYSHSPVFAPLIERIIGKGLVWVEGQSEHRRMRSITAPAFSLENVRNMNDDIWSIASTLQTKLAAHITANTPPDEKETKKSAGIAVDLIDWSAAASLDVIGRCGFKHDFQFAETEDGKSILQHWRTQVSAGMLPSAFIGLVVLRTFPFITSLPIPAIQAQGAIKTTVQKLAQRLIDSDRSEHNTDVLSLLLLAREREEKHRRVSSEELIEHITTFSLVGYETASSVIHFTLWALAKDPACQQKLRQEILQFGREPTFDEIWNGEALPYLEAVVKEGLRIFPSSSHTEKMVEKDDVIPLRWPVRTADGKRVLHKIPVTKGQVIHIPSRTVNRLACVWGPDADQFDPARWLDPARMPASGDLTNGWAGIFSFSEGPRTCVGYRLALLEIKIFLFAIIRGFVLEDLGEPVVPVFSSTLQPRVKGKEGQGVQLPVRVSIYNP